MIDKLTELLSSGLVPFFMPTNGSQGSTRINVVRIIEILIMLAFLTAFTWHNQEMSRQEMGHMQEDIQRNGANIDRVGVSLNRHMNGE